MSCGGFEAGPGASTGQLSRRQLAGPAAFEGDSITLDAQTANPVTIRFAAVNGNGQDAKDENDLSVVCVVRFGQFDCVLGGDLSGKKTSNYRDIETSVGPKLGQVEVYKVHHHGSRNSSNTNFLATIRPKVGVLSVGDGNKHKHPNKEPLDHLHALGVVTYWTERGYDKTPLTVLDQVGGNIVVESAPHATTFTVTWGWTNSATYEVWNPIGTGTQQFAWSKKAQVYHFADCVYVRNINPANLENGTTPPEGKRLHLGCPK